MAQLNHGTADLRRVQRSIDQAREDLREDDPDMIDDATIVALLKLDLLREFCQVLIDGSRLDTFLERHHLPLP